MGIENYIFTPCPMIKSSHKTKRINNMARHFKTNTNSFTIAHYILLFLVIGLCICIVAWILIVRHNNNPTNNVTPTITHINNASPCVQRTINTVEKMWRYDPKSVPQKYWNIAIEYLNEPISARTYGLCQDVAFVCHTGQIRRECDPCAVPSARAIAKQQQIADMITMNCSEK